MPFTLKPGASINSHKSNSTACAGAAPQFFSFKESKRSQGDAGGFGLLNICPSSFKQFMNSDIGYKLLYHYAKTQGITKESINANSVFDNLPSLQIREFAIDSELDQLVNLFRDLVNVFNPGDKNAPNNSVKADSTKKQPAQGAAVSESKNIADKIKSIWKDLADKLNSEGFYTTIFGSKVDKYAKNYSMSPEYNKVVRFPFAVYYKLLSCVTTNAYEVPIHPDVVMQANSEGFQGAEPYAVSFPGQGMIGSIPIIGKVISRIMSSISINTSPVWDPSKTSNTGPTINCKFKLFNDTVEAATINFIFVNTIGPNNMWYNYSIFKRAPALYDIKINGIYRYYMCTANVTIKPAGPVRKVPMAILKQLFMKYYGAQSFISPSSSTENELVSIPDIYDVELSFTSMLPNNFNNFLYVYAGNPDIMKSDKGYQGNIVVDFIKALKQLVKI